MSIVDWPDWWVGPALPGYTPPLRDSEIIDARLAAQAAQVEPARQLPTDPAARKQVPLATFLLDYFPDAFIDLARCSYIANEQHNPGEPLHWAREKSTDHLDCLMRHLMQHGKIDSDKVLHDTKVAWRAMANLQLTIERLRAEGVQYP